MVPKVGTEQQINGDDNFFAAERELSGRFILLDE